MKKFKICLLEIHQKGPVCLTSTQLFKKTSGGHAEALGVYLNSKSFLNF